MFITVRYGLDQSLLFNPSCTVVNLLRSIRIRCGYGNSNIDIDLADEAGVMKELGKYQYECADKLLSPNHIYVLIGRLPAATSSPDGEADVLSEQDSFAHKTSCSFVPLLDRYEELLPNYRLQLFSDSNHANKSPTPNNKNSIRKRCRKYGRANVKD
ncbi:uncharacterized protein LOC117120149 [Anneissia japonica]|uniref:uncharacterized protein LOC117120149 n=1 Tax=Anneissia japonica TaxID=1529436 RepID=UPI001425B33B|nr:uncharacterized protein LOC117120149 [Anneissia japonica]